MGRILTRERFGTPQILAAMLLLIFVGECIWLVAHRPPGVVSAEEYSRLQEGMAQWHGAGIAGTPDVKPSDPDLQMRAPVFDEDHSPLWYLLQSAPVAMIRPGHSYAIYVWASRVPSVLIGVLLGASLWYVSRRLYGNSGGYIALALYCFSPAVLSSSALWLTEPQIPGSWGTFGAIFTAIAVSHTLYAPREVVLWNWRRTLLLGISLSLAIGSQFSLIIVVPVLAAFMFYLAPERKAAAATILATAILISLVVIFACYFFHPALFWRGLASAHFFDVNGHALTMRASYSQFFQEISSAGPVLLVLVPAALVTYFRWPRSRYFGNSAPLICAVLFAVLRIAAPHHANSIYGLLAIIFILVFIAGVAADLLETERRELAAALIIGSIAAHAAWNLMGLAGLSSVPR